MNSSGKNHFSMRLPCKMLLIKKTLQAKYLFYMI